MNRLLGDRTNSDNLAKSQVSVLQNPQAIEFFLVRRGQTCFSATAAAHVLARRAMNLSERTAPGYAQQGNARLLQPLWGLEKLVKVQQVVFVPLDDDCADICTDYFERFMPVLKFHSRLSSVAGTTNTATYRLRLSLLRRLNLLILPPSTHIGQLV
ncbi:MAG: hypothetical protein ICV55_11855 [Coleofasciculus sp. C3-bin4]|nr:hypothetical protein [Coleofasciculus sp. C3-bin4]